MPLQTACNAVGHGYPRADLRNAFQLTITAREIQRIHLQSLHLPFNLGSVLRDPSLSTWDHWQSSAHELGYFNHEATYTAGRLHSSTWEPSNRRAMERLGPYCHQSRHRRTLRSRRSPSIRRCSSSDSRPPVTEGSAAT